MPAEGVVGDMGNASGVSDWKEAGGASGMERLEVGAVSRMIR